MMDLNPRLNGHGRWLVLKVLLGVVTALAARLAAAQDESAPTLVGSPVFTSSARCPLAGRLTFRTSYPCRAVVEARLGGRTWVMPHHDREEERHNVTVLGLRAGQEHELVIRLTSASRSTECEPVEVTPPLLPDSLPTIRIHHSNPELMEPGVTVFNAFLWENDQSSKTFGLFLAVDPAGEVVWFHEIDSPSGVIRRLQNGNLLYFFGTKPLGLREIAPTGETVCEWKATAMDEAVPDGAIAVGVDTFHHDACELPGGNLLVLSTELRRLERFPVDESSPHRGFAAANVVGDVIVEFQRDGTVVGEWRLLDILDPRRISYGSHDTFWNGRAYEDVEGGTKDWSHANALTYDERDDSLVVSLRHQDAVVKIDRQSGELKWILGTPRGWRGAWGRKVLRSAGLIEWPYHAHAPEVTPHGTLLLFDNGNHRAVPPGRKMKPTDAYSRVVEFDIDEAAGTAREVWSYGGPGPGRFYAPFLGDANLLPITDHVLVTIGGRIVDDQGHPVDNPPGSVQWARITEVTHDDEARSVFEMTLDDRETRPSLGWSVYRAERWANFIPLPEGE